MSTETISREDFYAQDPVTANKALYFIRAQYAAAGVNMDVPTDPGLLAVYRNSLAVGMVELLKQLGV